MITLWNNQGGEKMRTVKPKNLKHSFFFFWFTSCDTSSLHHSNLSYLYTCSIWLESLSIMPFFCPMLLNVTSASTIQASSVMSSYSFLYSRANFVQTKRVSCICDLSSWTSMMLLPWTAYITRRELLNTLIPNILPYFSLKTNHEGIYNLSIPTLYTPLGLSFFFNTKSLYYLLCRVFQTLAELFCMTHRICYYATFPTNFWKHLFPDRFLYMPFL